MAAHSQERPLDLAVVAIEETIVFSDGKATTSTILKGGSTNKYCGTIVETHDIPQAAPQPCHAKSAAGSTVDRKALNTR